MSASTPPPGATAPPPPLAPPEEEFWERYSPHHEFPLSSVGSVALHIGGLVLFILALWLLSRMTITDKTAVPLRAVTLADGDGVEGRGSGGGTNQKENVDPNRQAIPKRNVPEVDLKDMPPEMKPFLPKVPSDQPGLRPEDLPQYSKFAGLDPALRDRLLEGMSGQKGTGPGKGAGGPGPEGAGGGHGNASSSASRGIRWELNFKTQSGEDYLEQLRAMKATLLIPQPKEWDTHKAYRLAEANIRGEDYDIAKLPGLHFIDDDSGSASRLARAMGLDFSPPKFLAFFPKEVEEELAAKERDFRKRKESEIFSTSFRILIRDGRPSITVIEQTPIRK
jgi:hypothetical protein